MKAIAYCTYINGTWRHYCPECWTQYEVEGIEWDAAMTFLNGDTLPCVVCDRDITD